MLEQKERRLDVTMCHRCLMRQKAEKALQGELCDKRAPRGLAWLSDGVYAVIPEKAPQICQVLSISHESMSFFYFGEPPLEQGLLSSAEIVVTGRGFLADNLPFKVISDTPLDERVSGKTGKRLCKVRFLALNEASRAQVDHVIALKEVVSIQ
ncbi:hypothetical protein [Desulfoluna butyratoxydans]|uniref:Uncharacterized protein n=1 Tax=Desulfoluna butyratoxydans TaxID=231438 RepID=A0A4U8YQR7_9BACT|nr:hypothetical protein [Desulfoluna butyratoxydans]VFQ46606.1 hypothetical protein MSL71_42760 [Desulfoluna butyratoxydans]